MSGGNFFGRLAPAFRAVRPLRLFALLAAALVAALVSDWLREDRVVFPAPVPKFTTVPAGK